MNKRVLFLNTVTLCDPLKKAFFSKRASEERIEAKRTAICGTCYSSFSIKDLKSTNFSTIKKRVTDEKIDFIEVSSQKRGNLNKKVMDSLLRTFPEKILLPVANWKSISGDYYPIFDKGDEYLQGSVPEELKKIKNVLGIA